MARPITNAPLGTSATRSLLREQIGDAIHSLRGQRIGDRAVHNARKSVKKSRATLRLLRDALPAVEYRGVNTALRDASAPLSARRDAKILIDALESLVRDRGDARLQTITQQVRRTLQRERQNLLRVSRTHGSPSAATAALRTLLRRVRGWSIPEDGWPVLCSGLRRTYKQGRKSLEAASERGSAEQLHEWRKHAKYLWHQLQILEPLWPGVLGEFANQAHKLSDHLGDDHDLFILRQKVCAQVTDNERSRDALRALLDRRRERLQRKSFTLGEKLFEQKPRAFANRLDGYWKAWKRKEAAQGRKHPRHQH